MKKIFLFLLITVFYINGYSQFEQLRVLTNQKTLATFGGGIKVDSAMILPVYPDTAAANITGVANFYPGNIIRVGNELWIRSSDATTWIKSINFTGILDNANAGAGYRFLKPGTQEIKTLFSDITILIDSTSNANGITIKVDTAIIATQFDLTQLSLGSSPNTNLGTGYRLLVPSSQGIKTLFNGYAVLMDSTTNANGITFFVDTTLIATPFDLSGINQKFGHPAGDFSGAEARTFDANNFKWIINDHKGVEFNARSTGAMTTDSGYFFVAADSYIDLNAPYRDGIDGGEVALELMGSVNFSPRVRLYMNRSSGRSGLRLDTIPTSLTHAYVFSSPNNTDTAFNFLNIQPNWIRIKSHNGIVSLDSVTWSNDTTGMYLLAKKRGGNGADRVYTLPIGSLGGASLRFGVAGEDATAAQNRTFSLSANDFLIDQTGAANFIRLRHNGTAARTSVNAFATSAYLQAEDKPDFITLSNISTNAGNASGVGAFNRMYITNSTSGNAQWFYQYDDSVVFKPTWYIVGQDMNFHVWNLPAGVGTKAIRYDPSTGKFTYADTTNVGLFADENFAENNLTATADRTHNWANFKFEMDSIGTLTMSSRTGTLEQRYTELGGKALLLGYDIYSQFDADDFTGLYVNNGSGSSSVFAEAKASFHYSSFEIKGDSISLKPDAGKINIDSLRSFSDVDHLIGWDIGNGVVGRVTIGANLTLINGELSATGGGGVNIYNSNGILTGNRTLTGLNNTFSLTFDSLSSFAVRRNNVDRFLMNSVGSRMKSPDGLNQFIAADNNLIIDLNSSTDDSLMISNLNTISYSSSDVVLVKKSGSDRVSVLPLSSLPGGGSGTVNSGDQFRAAYYVTNPTGTVVDDWAGVKFGQTNINTEIVQQATTETMLLMTQIASATASFIDMKNSGGTTLASISKDGYGRFERVGIGVAPTYPLHVESSSSHPVGTPIAFFASTNVASTVSIQGTQAGNLTLYGGESNDRYWIITTDANQGSGLGIMNGFGIRAIWIQNNSNNPRVLIGESSDPQRKLEVREDNSTTNTVTYTERTTIRTDATPATGIGIGKEWMIQTAAANHEIMATMEVITTDVTNLTEDADIVFKTMKAGAAASEDLRITNGTIKVQTITQDDAETKVLVWNSTDKDVQWRDASTLGGGSGLGDPGANGIVVRTALNTTIARTITGTADEITVADGNGVSANPTISLSSTLNLNAKIVQVQDNNFTIQDNTTTTKKLVFELSGITAATTRTLTAPDASGTILLNDNTATITGKSIDASQLTGTINIARLTNVKQAKGITIVSPTASENATIFYTTQAITIEEVRGVMLGTSQSLTLVLNYGDTRDAADGTIVASIQFDSGETGYQTGGFAFTLNTSSIPAGNYIWLTTSATSGTINDFNLTITYRQ